MRAQRTHTGVVPAPTTSVSVNDDQRRSLFMIASVLLNYPTADLDQQLDVIEEALAALPSPLVENINHFISYARRTPSLAREEHYVDTFDQKRRCSLYLSYYAVGDTRQRGAAILAFKEAIETLGFFIEREELPDHLSLVLEAAALVEGAAHTMACGMLAAHRDGLEVLRQALSTLDSPYAMIVEVVCAVLPEIDEQTKDNFLELIRSGPPSELVGITTDLPFPSVQPDLL